MKYLLVSSLALVSGALAQRTITVYNACPFTIWYVHHLPLGGTDHDGAITGLQ
jgi:hypothetical protein